MSGELRDCKQGCCSEAMEDLHEGMEEEPCMMPCHECEMSPRTGRPGAQGGAVGRRAGWLGSVWGGEPYTVHPQEYDTWARSIRRSGAQGCVLGRCGRCCGSFWGVFRTFSVVVDCVELGPLGSVHRGAQVPQ